MQVSLIGLRHLEQARIPISARLNSGSGWIDGMTLFPMLGGSVQHSQSPIDAEGGAVMEPVWNLKFRHRWSILLTTSN
jgi:hypothetical protein